MSELPDQPTDARERLLSHFKGDEAEHGSKWDELWKEGFLPWDKGFPSPALVDLLAERQDLFEEVPKGRRRKALVPGCGKGYDVLLLSAHGYDAYGLEISGKALEAAKQNEKETSGDDVYKPKDGVEKGSVTWLEGDYFKDDFLKNVEGDGVFDLIYDYTIKFLCALPPSLRPAWSARQVQLLAPEGRLICLEFPTYKPPSTGGPPWALPPKIYEAHLPRPGERLPYGEDGSLRDDMLGKPSHLGLQRLAHFQPKRTHKIGYSAEGKVTDWVSVWSHPKS
ncbi:thiol methyltransferase-like protein [Tricladium varicosporioides]|nr:thiol methyltransferase-like protein [Hymenoscyphus varicosporioides]